MKVKQKKEKCKEYKQNGRNIPLLLIINSGFAIVYKFIFCIIMANNFAMMLGGTVLVENIFAIPGLGSMLLTSISGRDYMVVASGVLIISIFVTGANLLVDILYGVLDPRIRER